jgi:hypothetical protein
MDKNSKSIINFSKKFEGRCNKRRISFSCTHFHSFITESREQRAETTEQRADIIEQRYSVSFRTRSLVCACAPSWQRGESREQRADREQTAESREKRAESRQERAHKREQRAEKREQTA